MAEYRREIGIKGALAVIAALGIGLSAIAFFPNAQTGTSHSSGTPEPFMGYLSSRVVSCSLATGVCSFILINNTTAPFAVQNCEMTLVQNESVTPSGYLARTFHQVNGTIRGPAVEGIPAGSSHTMGNGSRLSEPGGSVAGTCTVPAAELSHQNPGDMAHGAVFVRLESDWNNLTAGQSTVIGFESVWSS
jgi:hypothetical protein